MRRVICTICLLLLLQGCSSIQQSATFRGKRIVVGQSSDSVERLLGQPDSASSAQRDPFWSNFKATKIDFWIHPGDYTIEWVYFGKTQSLIIWFGGSAVQGMWLVETSRIK